MRPGAFTGLAALTLAACNNPGAAAGADGRICADIKAAGPPADAAGAVDDCLHRWAYSLAGARDAADVTADAVVAACGAPLGRWNEAALARQGAAPDDQGAVSLTTGQPTNALAEHSAFARGRAEFYVVQARAGRCAAPAAANGVPIGAPSL